MAYWKNFASALAVAGLIGFGGLSVGCEEGPGEEMGEALDNAGDNVQDAAENAGDRMENAGERMEDAVD